MSESPFKVDDGQFMVPGEVKGLLVLLDALNDASHEDTGHFGDLSLGLVGVYDGNGEPVAQVKWNYDTKSYVAYGPNYTEE